MIAAPVKKTGRSVVERKAKRNHTHWVSVLMCDFLRFAPIITATANPSRMVFLLAALSAIATSLNGLLTRIHMEYAHTAYILRGVSESDRTK